MWVKVSSTECGEKPTRSPRSRGGALKGLACPALRFSLVRYQQVPALAEESIYLSAAPRTLSRKSHYWYREAVRLQCCCYNVLYSGGF